MNALNPLFQFEADFATSLRCISMQVRYKLDTCGIKLKLSHWNQFSYADRSALLTLPCITAAEISTYHQTLQSLVTAYTGNPAAEFSPDPHPDWMKGDRIPLALLEKAQELGLTLTLSQWTRLTFLQRFALLKLSRPSHENHNFLIAFQEFHLIS